MEFGAARRCRGTSAGCLIAGRVISSQCVFVCCPSLGVHTENDHFNSFSVGGDHKEIGRCHASNSSVFLQREAAVFAQNGGERDGCIVFSHRRIECVLIAGFQTHLFGGSGDRKHVD